MRLMMLLILLWLGGCQPFVRLPLQTAWFEGRTVRYVTTEASDAGVARDMNINYAPRLRNAVPSYPKRPGVPTVLERVYVFPEAEQSRTVFASIPDPVGPESLDTNYSPLWLMVEVRWLDPTLVVPLTSEDAILAAEEGGMVSLKRTDVVVNCPILEVKN